MRLLRSRRGDWIQIFLILFFLLLILFAILLLTLESKRLEVKRPELTGDLVNQKANAFLISAMRTSTGAGQLADLIIMDERSVSGKGQYDDAIYDAVAKSIGQSSVVYTLTVDYTNGDSLSMTNVVDSTQTYYATGITAQPVSLYLPGSAGNTKVTLLVYFYDDILAAGKSVPPTSVKNGRTTGGAYSPVTGQPRNSPQPTCLSDQDIANTCASAGGVFSQAFADCKTRLKYQEQGKGCKYVSI